MQKNLLYLGIICIPFYEVLVTLLMPHKALSFGDTRGSKEILTINIILLFTIISFYKGTLGKVGKWILICVGFVLFSISVAPEFQFFVQGFNLTGFWHYKPAFYITVYLLFLSSVTGFKWNDGDIDKVLLTMVYTGGIMSIYVISQSLGLDQFYGQLNPRNPAANFTPRALIGGTLGNPTIVSPFLAILIPLSLYFKKHFISIAMIIGVCLTKSYVAIGAMILGLTFFFGLKNKKCFISFIVLCICALTFTGYSFYKNDKLFTYIEKQSSGRYGVWENIVKDIDSPPFPDSSSIFPYTGRGLGSFSYVFTKKHNTIYDKAHNAYLEILYECGIFGCIFFILMIGNIILSGIKHALFFYDGRIRAITTSLFISAVCAGGVFIYQLSVFQFYLVLLIGMLFFIQGEYNEVKMEL